MEQSGEGLIKRERFQLGKLGFCFPGAVEVSVGLGSIPFHLRAATVLRLIAWLVMYTH